MFSIRMDFVGVSMKTLRIALLIITFGIGIINPLFEDYKAFEAYKGESYDTSIKYLQVKQIENPHDPELNYNLGVAHFRAAQYANALKDFERVIENADEKNPLGIQSLYNAGNSLVKETERVLGPDWEAKKVEDKKIESSLKDLERAVVRYSQAQAIKEMPEAQQNQAYAEKLIEKLKKKQQEQNQQEKDNKDNKDDKKDKDSKDKNKNKEKKQDGKDDGQNSSEGDDSKGNNASDKKDKGKDKKDKSSKDKDSGKDDKDKEDGDDSANEKKDDDKDNDGDEKEDKKKPKNKGNDKKDRGEEPEEDASDKKPGDYKKEKQPQPEADQKEDADKPQEPQEGGTRPQEQEQGSEGQSSEGAAGGSDQGQQQDAVYDVLKADDSMEKKAMRALLDDLDEKEAAKQKALMQYQSKSAATSGEVGQKPW